MSDMHGHVAVERSKLEIPVIIVRLSINSVCINVSLGDHIKCGCTRRCTWTHHEKGCMGRGLCSGGL
jgi:hypothetical protein